MTSVVSSAAPVRLRCGILVDAPGVNAWQAATLHHLERSGVAELELVVTVEGSHVPRGGQDREGSPRPAPGGRLARAGFDLVATRISRSRATRPHEGAAWPEGVPTLHARAVPAGPAGVAFRDADLESIRNHRLDVVIWLGGGTPAGAVAEVARHGTWLFHHGDEELYEGAPPGFWELLDAQPVVGAALRRLPLRGDAGVTLRRGWFAVAPESYARTRDRLLMGASAWPAHVCREIALGASDADWQRSPAAGGIAPRAMGLRPLFRFLAVMARWRLRRAWHHGLRHDDWNVGVVDAPVESFLAVDAVHDVAWAPVRKGHYAADPFGRWGDDGTLQVIYEEYSHATGQASIATRRWSRERGWGPSGTTLHVGNHLSYPFFLEHEGRYLLLPESRASGKLVLYASDDPAGPWEPHATLDVNGDIADATLLHHEGRWWMFAALPSRLNPSTELALWFSDRPEGPWREHPLNPVLVDVRSARPAGPFFVVDGQLYRPAQDCSTGYGDRLVIKRIAHLTTEQYAEEAVAVVRPDRHGPFPYGLHMLTSVGSVTLVDGKRRIWDTAALVRLIRRRTPL